MEKLSKMSGKGQRIQWKRNMIATKLMLCLILFANI
jgi:hypothetical protein